MRDARPPWASKFFRFHAVFGKIWRVHAPPGGFTPPPRENPGSATDMDELERRLSLTIQKTIKENMSSANDEKLKPIQQSLDSLLEKDKKTDRLHEDMKKVLTDKYVITQRFHSLIAKKERTKS